MPRKRFRASEIAPPEVFSASCFSKPTTRKDLFPWGRLGAGATWSGSTRKFVSSLQLPVFFSSYESKQRLWKRPIFVLSRSAFVAVFLPKWASCGQKGRAARRARTNTPRRRRKQPEKERIRSPWSPQKQIIQKIQRWMRNDYIRVLIAFYVGWEEG